MTPEKPKPTLSVFLQSAQLIVIVIGVAGGFMMIGRRDATLDQNGVQISELRAICSDLARTVGNLSISDATQSERMQSINDRLELLETRTR